MKHFNLLKQLLLIPLLVLGAGLAAVAQPLSGVYTIGGTSPNYATLAAAVADLNTKGVNGNVWFNIRTGTYSSTTNWVADISGGYVGASTYRVTFQSESGNKADVTISNANTSSVNYIFRSSGSGNITIRNMTLESTASSYTHLVELSGAASSDSFYNLTLNAPTSSSSSNSPALIYGYFFSGNNNVIYNNTFNNSYYGIYLYGSSSPMPTGTVVANNTFTSQYAYGAYLWYLKDLKFLSNTINKTSNTTTYYAAYLYNCTDALRVNSNTITLSGTSSSHYGIYASYCSGSSSNTTNRPQATGNSISITTTTASTNAALYMSFFNSYWTLSSNTVTQNATSGTTYQWYNYYNTYMSCNSNSLTASATSGSIWNYVSYQYSDYSTFNSNTISQTTTTGTMYPLAYAGYYSNGTTTSNNAITCTATSSGSVYGPYFCMYSGSNNTMSGNTLNSTQSTSGSKIGFYYTIVYSANNNTVTNNTINFGTTGTGYCYGVYNSIYSSCSNNNFSGNTVKATTSSTGTQYGWAYSIYSSCNNNTVNNNNIEIINNATSGTHYGMNNCFNSSCSSNTYNGNSLKVTTNGTGTFYGAYYMNYYYCTNNTFNNNTWYFSRPSTSSGTMYGTNFCNYYYCTGTTFNNNTMTVNGGTGSTYGLYQSWYYYSDNATFNNNTVNVLGTGTGTATVGYFTFYTSNNQSINNNNLSVQNGSGSTYGLYYMSSINNLTFTKNNLSVKGTGSAFEYGIYSYLYGNTGYTFTDNNLSFESGTGTIYGLYTYYANTATFKNNVINGKSNGQVYSMYPNYSTNAYFTNNTVNCNSTNGNSCPLFVYDYYGNSPANSSYFYNNVFSNSMSAGVPVRIAYWQPGQTLDFDYNNYYCKTTNPTWAVHSVLYSTSGSIPGPGTRNLNQIRAYGYDRGSIAYNPGYIDSSSNLRPDPTRPESWSLNGRGTHITGNNLDILGNTRVTSKAAGVPDIGAYEFTPTSIPPLAAASATPALGTTTYYIFGQDSVMSIDWPASGSIPTDMNVREYTGVIAPGYTAALGPTYMYYYVDAQPVGGTAPFTTNSTIYYSDPQSGTTAESALRMAQKDGSNPWVAHPHSSSGANAALNKIYKNGLTNFGLLTGADIANNAGALDIVTPTPLFCAGTYTLSAKIANLGNNTITTVKVNYTVDGGPVSSVTYTTPILSQAAGVNTATVSLGSISFTNKAKWIKIWTSDPNNVTDPVPMDDTILLRWGPGLSGEYTVGGTTPDYATVADAVADLSKFGVCGPVWFNIRPGTYTDRLVLKNAAGMNTTNRVTFRSENGTASSVILTTTGNVVSFDANASNFTLNKLTIAMTGTSNQTVEVLSGNARDSINGCIITAPTGSSAYVMRIYQPSSVIDRLTVSNSTLSGGGYGMYFYAYNGSATNQLGMTNCVFENNLFQNQAYYPMYFNYVGNSKIKYNTFTSTYTPYYGMYLYYSKGGDIIGNKILFTSNIYSYGYGMYLYDYSNTASTPYNIRNNVIVMAGSNSFNSGYGGMNIYSSYCNVDNNSIAISASGGSALILYNYSGYDQSVNVRNNALAHYGGGNAVYVASTPGSGVAMDYNNYYTTGTSLVGGSVTADTLTRWRILSGRDLNSISYNPGFTSPLNLVPDVTNDASWSLNGRGVHITGNDKDVDGNTRVVNREDGVPDIGAYEFTPQTIPPVAKAIPATVVAGGTQVFTFGQDTVAKITWNQNTYVPSTVAVRQWTGTVPPSFPVANHMYFYTDIAAIPVTYISDIDLYYKDPWTGKIPAAQESNIRMVRKESNSRPWTAYNGTSSSTSTARNLMVAPTLTGLGYFTGIENGAIFSANIKPLAPVVFCPGGSVTLQSGFNSTDYTHQWLHNGLDIVGANAPTYTAVMSGDYSVRVIENATSNSVTSNAVAVTIVSTPAAVVAASGPTIVCTGNNVTLNVGTGTGLSYQWMQNGIDIPGASNSTYIATTSGTYSVKVKNIGCTNLSNPVTVVQGPVSVNLGNDTSFCTAFPLNLDAKNAGAKFLWSTGDTSQTITISAYGKHKIAVHVDAGVNCVAKDTIDVEISPMPAVNGINYIKAFGNTFKFSPAGAQYVESYLWIFGDGSTDTTSSILHEYNGGTFKLKLVVFNGCGSDTTELDLPLTVNDVTNHSDFELYPNPAKSNITLKVYGEAQFSDVVIVNSIGQIVMRENGANTKSRTFDIRMLPDGHYFIRANTVDGKVISKPFQIIR